MGVQRSISMNTSRKKFVFLFLIAGFAFLFVTTSLLGSTGLRGFPQPPDSILRTGHDSPIAWKRAASHVLFPIKVVLIGPLALPQVKVLKDDPPPPFIGIYLVGYWTLLAVALYSLIGLSKRSTV